MTVESTHAGDRTSTTSRRPSRLAGFNTDLILDGYGMGFFTSHRHRTTHPCFDTWPYNIGDQFVAFALVKLLRFDEFYTINVTATQEEFDIINAECDAFLIRGSNFIYPGFFSKYFYMEWLSKIRIPIIYIGAGIQAKLGEDLELLLDDIECLKYIHSSCVSCSVRSPMAAELLQRYGIQNVRVTGCPTIVWSQKPSIKVRPPSWDNVAWTVTEMGHFPEGYNEQFRLMTLLHKKAQQLNIMTQGGEVILQDYIFWRDEVILSQRIETRISAGLVKATLERKSVSQLAEAVHRYYHQVPPEVRQCLLDRSFFSNQVSDYLKFVRTLSLLCGTRLHGNIMGLSQGIPTVFAVHDARTKDMVEFMQAPLINLFNYHGTFDLNEFDWSPFEQTYAKIYQGFRDFLNENNLTHNLL